MIYILFIQLSLEPNSQYQSTESKIKLYPYNILIFDPLDIYFQKIPPLPEAGSSVAPENMTAVKILTFLTP